MMNDGLQLIYIHEPTFGVRIRSVCFTSAVRMTRASCCSALYMPQKISCFLKVICKYRHLILALILKSWVAHNHNLLSNEMYRDVTMSKQWPRSTCFSVMIRGNSADLQNICIKMSNCCAFIL